jgi:L-lactate dehydrogenase
MGNKVTIIGAGSVGATIANDMVVMNIATDIVLVDIDERKAFGEAMDIYQGTSFGAPAIVRAGDYTDAADSSIVVIGRTGRPGWSWPRPMWTSSRTSPPRWSPTPPTPSTSSYPTPWM